MTSVRVFNVSTPPPVKCMNPPLQLFIFFTLPISPGIYLLLFLASLNLKNNISNYYLYSSLISTLSMGSIMISFIFSIWLSELSALYNLFLFPYYSLFLFFPIIIPYIFSFPITLCPFLACTVIILISLRFTLLLCTFSLFPIINPTLTLCLSLFFYNSAYTSLA